MAMQWPCRVQCYGRTYMSADATALDALSRLLVERRLVEANRYRVGASWPRGRMKRLQQQAPTQDKEVMLRTGGSISVLGEFNICTLGHDERVLLSAIADAMRQYEQAVSKDSAAPLPGPRPSGEGVLSDKSEPQQFAEGREK